MLSSSPQNNEVFVDEDVNVNFAAAVGAGPTCSFNNNETWKCTAGVEKSKCTCRKGLCGSALVNWAKVSYHSPGESKRSHKCVNQHGGTHGDIGCVADDRMFIEERHNLMDPLGHSFEWFCNNELRKTYPSLDCDPKNKDFHWFYKAWGHWKPGSWDNYSNWYSEPLGQDVLHQWE